ncbi:hypothetical protein JZ751_003806, partial [Albula glossodonta]
MPQPKSRKIAVLGYRSVGKSSLTIQFVEGQFVDSYDPTIENSGRRCERVEGTLRNVWRSRGLNECAERLQRERSRLKRAHSSSAREECGVGSATGHGLRGGSVGR